MKRPNFFIIGAPKCGTTSLASWMSHHPQVYMSPVKEPHHFNTDRSDLRTPSRKAYEKLFSAATNAHKAIGEASVWYLYSEPALRQILDYSPEARFIICLRNPIDMAYSLHRQLIYNGYENIIDFEEAWRTQFKRIDGKKFPNKFEDIRQNFYGDVCSLGKYYEKAMEICGENRIHSVILDDIRDNPRKEYLKVCDFLDIERCFPSNFSVENKAKEVKNPLLFNIATQLGNLKKRFPVQSNFGIYNYLISLSVAHHSTINISNSLKNELCEYFESDLLLLSDLLRRDLSAWLV